VLYTVVNADDGRIFLDKGNALEMDWWFNSHRYYKVLFVRRKISIHRTAPDVMTFYVQLFWKGKNRGKYRTEYSGMENSQTRTG
jgi:hypothetical protein